MDRRSRILDTIDEIGRGERGVANGDGEAQEDTAVRLATERRRPEPRERAGGRRGIGARGGEQQPQEQLQEEESKQA